MVRWSCTGFYFHSVKNAVGVIAKWQTAALRKKKKRKKKENGNVFQKAKVENEKNKSANNCLYRKTSTADFRFNGGLIPIIMLETIIN